MGKTILGKIYVGDNETVLFILNEGVSQIVLMNGECDSKVLVDDMGSDKKLNFNEHHQITGIYRLRRGCEKTIYFTDNYNPPRYFNISDPNSFKEIVNTSPVIEYGALDPDKLLLQKTYDSIPRISVEIGENGQLLSGSYNIAVRYVDADLNPSEWIYATEPIMIWQSNETSFNKIRASSNEDIEYRKYGPTNKSIRVSVENRDCDHSYTFVQFAMICATSGTGFVNDVVYSQLVELNFNKNNGIYDDVELIYNFNGDSTTIKGSEDEIIANTEIFDRVKTIEQADNRLVMGNVTDMDIDWCKLQKYASRIVSDCVVKEISVTNYNDDCNHKNPMVLYNNGVGYQPGEIYSFGIVYVFENGAKSPVFHIPGRAHYTNSNATLCGGNIAMQQDNNVCNNASYSEVSMACEGFKYWGCDSLGNELDGEKIRHHRFPYKPLYLYENENNKQESVYLYHYNMYVGKIKGTIIRGKFKRNCDFIFVKYNMTDTSSNINDENFELEIPIDELDSVNEFKSGFSHPNENNGQYNYLDTYTIDGNNTEVDYGNTSLNHIVSAKRKYKKIIDIHISENGEVKFSRIQEWPQLVKVNAGPFTLSSWVTTGSSLSSKLTGGQYAAIVTASMLTLNAATGSVLYLKYREETNDEVENFDESIFENTDNSSNVQQNDRNGVRVAHFSMNDYPTRIVKFLYDNSNDSQNQDDVVNPLSKYKFSTNRKHNYGLWKFEKKFRMNTNICFRIERTCENIIKRYSDRKEYIFGIKFGNIDIPDSKYLNGHNVIGYYFVQNERTKDDMTVLDSAILTPMFNENNSSNVNNRKMIVSGRIFVDDSYHNTFNFPEMSYDFSFNNDNNRIHTNLLKNISNHSVGFINPRFKFNKEELYFTKFRHIGNYELIESSEIIDENTDTSIPVHAIGYSNNCDDLWITNDVQAGSSYDKKINKKKDRDNDGFDLHIFHKDSFVRFVPCTNVSYSIDRKDIHYVLPSSEISKTMFGNVKTIYNVSGDNNQGMIVSENIPFDTKSMFKDKLSEKIKRLPYGYIERELEDYYPDFNNRPYYIISDFYRVNDKHFKYSGIFRGDCFSSSMKYTTGMQYDIRMKKRGKKNTVWQYIVGALGVAGGLAGATFTGGATASIIGPSISLIQNGIRTDVAFNTMKRFSSNNGKKALNDFWVKNIIDVEHDDDEIEWLFESVDGLVFESVLNINWRVGTSISDITDYLDPYKYNPSELRQYFQKKLTYSDKERKDGRMYRGFSLAEIYDINKDFQRRNKQKKYYCIPITHRCCSECENGFPKRIVYSQKSFSEERTDNYKIFLPGNYTDIGGENGDIVHISNQGQDSFMVFTEEGLWQLIPNKQQKVNQITQVVSFIGTGDFFSTPAQIVTKNDMNLCFGSRHQNSFLSTPKGLFWYSEHDNALYTFADKMPVDIFKQYGMSKFFEREGRIRTDIDWYKKYRTKYPFKDNVSSELGTGYVLGYDNKYDRVLITKKDNRCSFLSECFYDEDKRQKDVVKSKIEEIIEDGGYNVCYKWSKEKCCYIIDYDTVDSNTSSSSYVSDNSVITKKTTGTIIYLQDIEYYSDSYLKNGLGISEKIVDIISNSIKDLSLIVCSNDMIKKLSKFYPTIIHYSTDDNEDVKNVCDFIEKEWEDEINPVDEMSYIIITSENKTYYAADNKKTITRINELSEYYDSFNVSVVPVLKKKVDVFPYNNLSSFMSAKSVTFSDIDLTYLSDNMCQIYDKIILGTEKQYNSNVSEYKEKLNEIRLLIIEIENNFEKEDFSIDMFDNLLLLISLYNTFNYWNILYNSYDFNNQDLFGNGSKNLLMLKDVSNEFNSFALQKLGAKWYDVSADYSNLESHMEDYDYTFYEYLNGVTSTSTLTTHIENIFDRLYLKYVKATNAVVYGGNNYSLLNNLAILFSVNINSIPFVENDNTIQNSELKRMKNSLKGTVPFGKKTSKNNINIHTDVFIGDYMNDKTIYGLNENVITNDTVEYKNTSETLSKQTTTSSVNIPTKKFEDNRIYLPNIENNIEDTDINVLNDNSFTISFKPGIGFISFHSYFPSLYVNISDSFFTWRVNDRYIYRHDIKGNYQRFYGDMYPFAIEMVERNNNMAYGPQTIDSVSILARTDEYVDDDFNEKRNVFFDKVYFYNNRQCSLLNRIVAKGNINDENYFEDYLDNEFANDIVSAENRESMWHINGFNDYRIDYSKSIHSFDNTDRENFMNDNGMLGWIDKSVDETILDRNKDWWDLEPFRGNYVCQRYFYNPLCDNNNIRMRIVLETVSKTQDNDNILK